MDFLGNRMDPVGRGEPLKVTVRLRPSHLPYPATCLHKHFVHGLIPEPFGEGPHGHAAHISVQQLHTDGGGARVCGCGKGSR